MASFCEALQPALSELRRRAFGIAPQLSFCLTFYQGKHTSVIENSIDFFSCVNRQSTCRHFNPSATVYCCRVVAPTLGSINDVLLKGSLLFSRACQARAVHLPSAPISQEPCPASYCIKNIRSRDLSQDFLRQAKPRSYCQKPTRTRGRGTAVDQTEFEGKGREPVENRREGKSKLFSQATNCTSLPQIMEREKAISRGHPQRDHGLLACSNPSRASHNSLGLLEPRGPLSKPTLAEPCLVELDVM